MWLQKGARQIGQRFCQRDVQIEGRETGPFFMALPDVRAHCGVSCANERLDSSIPGRHTWQGSKQIPMLLECIG